MGRALNQLVGLGRLKAMADRDIAASRATREVFPHSGLYGPGGLGKTSFAEAVAQDLGYHFDMVEGAMFKCRRAILERLSQSSLAAEARGKRLIFFIDEVHRLAKEPQEALYYPMLEFFLPDSRTKLQPFSLFAATTHPHELLRPFRSRLKNEWSFQRYDLCDIEVMITRALTDYGLMIDSGVVELVSKRCLGVPRRAYNIALKIRNEVLFRGGELSVSVQDCENTFALEGIDPIGLDLDQVAYLKVLSEARGQPKGVGGIAGMLDRDVEVVEDSIEPVLLSLKFIDRTSRGRVLTELGYVHLGRTGQLEGSI